MNSYTVVFEGLRETDLDGLEGEDHLVGHGENVGAGFLHFFGVVF